MHIHTSIIQAQVEQMDNSIISSLIILKLEKKKDLWRIHIKNLPNQCN